MAGKPSPRTRSRSSSPILLVTLSLLALSILFFLFSLSPRTLPSDTFRTRKPETSFVAALEHFLIHGAPKSPSAALLVRGTDDVVRDLDDSMYGIESERVLGDPYFPVGMPIRVYVYEMPSKFTYDLLWLFWNTYRDTSNLTSNGSPVHRLIEQHSIDFWLWADLIAPESERLLKSVVRVDRQEEADLFYIPFFTTISFFLLEKQQCKALYRVKIEHFNITFGKFHLQRDSPKREGYLSFSEADKYDLPVKSTRCAHPRNAVRCTTGKRDALNWVTDQPAWKRSGGRDHILPVHHPWSFKSVRKFMKNAIWLLPDMDSTGNWYKPGQVFLEKDLILPYVPNLDLCDAKCLEESYSKRTTLLFFRGRLKRNAGGKIRAKLVAELSGAKDVIIEEGTAGEGGKEAAQNGMRRSIFCLSPAGDTPSSARLFDAIVSGCIPVIVSDELELPFEGILDYRKIALFVSSSDAVQPGWLLTFLKTVSPAHIREMQQNVVKYARHFLYSSPAQPLGAEDLVWKMMAGKLVNIKLHTRRSQRVVKQSRSLCTCDCQGANITGPGRLF